MEIDTNPYRCLQANINPTEFEVFCLETLKAYAEREGLQDFEIKHNQKIETYDSTYQIDVLVEYTALGCHNKVIVECKHHNKHGLCVAAGQPFAAAAAASTGSTPTPRRASVAGQPPEGRLLDQRPNPRAEVAL